MRDWPKTPKPRYRRAVFIDRDGTITADTHFTHRIVDLRFLDRSLVALRLLAAMPVHIIVVSNQAGIALGLFGKKDMMLFNAELRLRVEQAGGRIDAFYYCPHKEPKHLARWEKPCLCAKPAPGMLLEAAKDFRLSLQDSFMIGDKLSDVAAGQAAGCSAILVKTGKAGMEEDENIYAVPDLVAPDLYGAARHVVEVLEEEVARRNLSQH